MNLEGNNDVDRGTEGRKSLVIPEGIIGWCGFRVFPTLINGSSQTRKITFN